MGWPYQVTGRSMSPTLNAEEVPVKKYNTASVYDDDGYLDGPTTEKRSLMPELDSSCQFGFPSIRKDFLNIFHDNSTKLPNTFYEGEYGSEWVFVNYWTVRNNHQGINLGDIVVFISPKNPSDYVIKRVVATEHQIIQTSKKCSKYSCETCSNKKAKKKQSTGSDIVVIPAGHCWVEGDNYETSVDSRTYGPIPIGLIFGKVTRVIFPLHRIRRLDKDQTNAIASVTPTRIIGSGGVPTRYQ